MCGFLISNSSIVTKDKESLIEEYLRFRGPDVSSGLIEHMGWKAYHSRLSIIGLSTANNQPMIDDKNGLLVFNGEILNYKALGQEYFNQDYQSDTKLLSDLLKENKLDLERLDGFFAFVYIDAEGKIKHAVRDFFGVKPLYYYEDESNGITFCSEPNVIKQLFNCSINEDSIEEYYATRAPIFSGSYFKGVNSVEPGSCFVQGHYFIIEKYLKCNYDTEVNYNNLNAAIDKGIDSRLVSDAPVGLLLSRGVDSHLLKSKANINKYYSIGFEGDEDIEFLKNKNYKNLSIIECEPREYREALKYLLELRGEPMSVPNEVLLYLIAKKASDDGIKVLLSGEGADEFFAGYDRVFTWAWQQKEFDLDVFLEKYCYIVPKKESRLYREFKKVFDNLGITNCFEKVRWFFIRYHMPVLFRRLDFSLMAAGVEGREPIANMHTFLESIRISPEELMGQSLGKIPLRKILSSYTGENFAYEKKVGFPVDLTKIFENKDNLSSYELWFKENLKALNI